METGTAERMGLSVDDAGAFDLAIGGFEKIEASLRRTATVAPTRSGPFSQSGTGAKCNRQQQQKSSADYPCGVTLSHLVRDQHRNEAARIVD